MPLTLQDLSRVVEPAQAGLRALAELVQTLAGDTARSLVAVGAVVDGPFHPDRQSARSVLVLEHVDLGLLKQLGERGPDLGAKGVGAPLIMTPHYIEASLDTFPLEFIEIDQRRCVILGDDPFGRLHFEAADVRLQCERELKTLLIDLRQGLLAAMGEEQFLEPVEVGVAERLVRTLRGLLWLKGAREPLPGPAVLEHAGDALGVALPTATSVLARGQRLTWPDFQTLYREVEQLGEYADAV